MRVLFYTAAALAASIASVAQAVKLDAESAISTQDYFASEYSQLSAFEDKKKDGEQQKAKKDEDMINQALTAMAPKPPTPTASAAATDAVDEAKKARAAEKKKQLEAEMEEEKLKKQREADKAAAAKEQASFDE